MTADEAAELLAAAGKNAECLQPYIVGKDLNQRPDSSASRWVINFHDWPLDRAGQYPGLIDIVRRKVKPKREKNNDPRRREIWWQFTRPAPELYTAIADLDHVLATPILSSTVMPVRVATGPVFGHKCIVFALDSFADLAFLSSDVHSVWVIRYTSTTRRDVSYSSSDVFLTLPRPELTSELSELGADLDASRRQLMLSRGWGLTTTYNHVHSPIDRDPYVEALRDLHREIDYAVLRAYEWDNLDPQIGHHPTKIGTRWTMSSEARFELLDRLLEENHRRHESQQQ